MRGGDGVPWPAAGAEFFGTFFFLYEKKLSDGDPWAGLGGGCWARLSGADCWARLSGRQDADRRPLPCASGAVAPELPGGCAGRAGRGRSVGPGAAGSVLMYPASLDDYKGSDVTHILTGTSEIGHIHWDESIHSLE